MLEGNKRTMEALDRLADQVLRLGKSVSTLSQNHFELSKRVKVLEKKQAAFEGVRYVSREEDIHG